MTTYYKAIRPDGASFADPSFRWLPEDGRIPTGGHLVKHLKPARHFGPSSQATARSYLSLSVEPADCTGFRWPCRLLVVEPVGAAREDDHYPHKRRVIAARVVGEVEAWRALGPNGRDVAAFLDLLRTLSGEQWAAAWAAARDAEWAAAWDAARDAAWDAARDAARAAAWDAARDAAWAAARDAARAAAWVAAWDAAWAAARDAARAAAWDAARDAARDAAWAAARSAAGEAAGVLAVRDMIGAEHFAALTAPMRAAGIYFEALAVQA